MLGCNYGPMSGGWWGGFFPAISLPLLAWGVTMLLFVYLGIRFFKYLSNNPNSPPKDRIDSLRILKVRFARGEISREEFLKMKQILLAL
jgi:putative membrane protein